MAMRTLPFVLLKTHIMTRRRPTRARANTTKSRTVPLGGMSVRSSDGIKNPGRCQRAQRLPRMRPPTTGPCSCCKRGWAKPLHPRLLEQWSSDENHEDEGTEIGQHGQRSECLKRFQGSRPDDYRGEHHNERETYESEQVPLKANPPPYYPTQPAAYAFPPFGDCGHDKPG